MYVGCGAKSALLSALALQVRISYIMKTKRCFHNRMDGAKYAPFIRTRVASSDKLYYENKSSFHNRMDGLKNSPFIFTCVASSDKLYYL